MVKKLLIVDSLVPEKLEDHPDVEWLILGLGVEPDEIAACKWVTGLDNAKVVYPHEQSKAAQRDTVAYMNDVVRGLPAYCDASVSHRKSSKCLEEPGFGSLWWFLEISELSPLRGRLFSQLFAVALVHQTVARLEPAEVVFANAGGEVASLFGSDGSPRSAAPSAGHGSGTGSTGRALVGYWWRALEYAVMSVVLWLACRGLGRAPATAARKPAVFTLFPGWWARSASGELIERFVPMLASDLSDGNLSVLAWLSLRPRSLAGTIAVFRKMFAGDDVAILQRYLSVRDLLSLFSIKRFRRLRRFVRDVAGVNLPRFLGFHVGHLVLAELERSLSKGELALDQLVAKSVRRAVRQLDIPVLFFRFEGQPLDRAILAGAPESCTTVGFWHSAICEVPNYVPLTLTVPVPSKFDQVVEGWFDPPRPQRMLAANAICQQNLFRYGYDATSAEICGPLRQHHFLRRYSHLIRDRRPRDEVPISILPVALPIATSEARGLLTSLAPVLTQFDFRHLVVKVHPAGHNDAVELVRSLFVDSGVSLTICASTSEFLDHVARAPWMISSGSTIAFEGMLLGATAIVYEPLSIFPPTSLSTFEGPLMAVSCGQDLVTAFSRVLNGEFDGASSQAEQQRLLSELYLRQGQYEAGRFIELISRIAEKDS